MLRHPRAGASCSDMSTCLLSQPARKPQISPRSGLNDSRTKVMSVDVSQCFYGELVRLKLLLLSLLFYTNTNCYTKVMWHFSVLCHAIFGTRELGL